MEGSLLSRHLFGCIEGNHENLQSGQVVCEPGFEPGTSRMRSRSANYTIVTFSKKKGNKEGRMNKHKGRDR